MSRVVVHHLTSVRRLPLIELDGLRTRVDLSDRLGPVEAFDLAAPAAFARGKRVSGWWSEAHARTQVDRLGRGHVSFSVDPARALALTAAAREADVERAWATARPLAAWLAEGEPPADLEVHVPLPVRAKHLRILAPIVDDATLGDWAPLVAAVADSDRVAAKLLMHLALALADDLEGPAFLAAAALAWRDEPDASDLSRRVGLADTEAVLTAVLAEHRAAAPAIVATLTTLLDELRLEGDDDGDVTQALYARSEATIDRNARDA